MYNKKDYINCKGKPTSMRFQTQREDKKKRRTNLNGGQFKGKANSQGGPTQRGDILKRNAI